MDENTNQQCNRHKTLDDWIVFRVTKLEKKVLAQKAKDSGRSLGNLLRRIIFKRDI